MTQITFDTTVRKKNEIFTAVAENEMVAVSAQTGKSYQLNEAGARIFSLLEYPRTVREVCERCEDIYQARDGMLRQDVLAFLRELARQGFIVCD